MAESQARHLPRGGGDAHRPGALGGAAGRQADPQALTGRPRLAPGGQSPRRAAPVRAARSVLPRSALPGACCPGPCCPGACCPGACCPGPCCPVRHRDRLPERELPAVLLGWASAEDPSLGLIDRQVVDAGLAPAHQAVRVEVPQLVAVAAPPLTVAIVALVLKAHRDPAVGKRPQILTQRVVEFALPFPGQELGDHTATGEERVAVAPHGILAVGQRYPFGIPRIPSVLGGLDLLGRGCLAERGKWWTV